MFDDALPEADRVPTPHSYFVPMVDMLAGVVFLLVIMLAASVLVVRPDFGAAQGMQQEIARIQQQLDAARAEDRLYLAPRRQALAATTLLLARLKTALAARGFSVSTDPAKGTLTLAGLTPFLPASPAVSADGERFAAVLAAVLAPELGCLAATPAAAGADCAAYDGVKLETAEIAAAGTADPAIAEARALGFMSALTTAAPGLLALKGNTGVDLLTFGPAAAGADLTLRVQMAVPPLP